MIRLDVRNVDSFFEVWSFPISDGAIGEDLVNGVRTNVFRMKGICIWFGDHDLFIDHKPVLLAMRVFTKCIFDDDGLAFVANDVGISDDRDG